jgi:hypothetical protein
VRRLWKQRAQPPAVELDALSLLDSRFTSEIWCGFAGEIAVHRASLLAFGR